VIQDDHNLDLELNPVLIHQQLFPGQYVPFAMNPPPSSVCWIFGGEY
jgi:hypothetical protein